MRQVTIRDGETVMVGDENESAVSDLFIQLTASIQARCKHENKDCVSTSESGSNTCFVRWYCPDCKLSYNDELTPAEYQKLLVLLEDTEIAS